MIFPNVWLSSVAKSTHMSIVDVQTKIESWLDKGHSIEYIKRVLVLTALAKGRKLCFVSNKGTN